MKTVRLLIDTSNDAFSEYPETEVARILKNIADKLENGLIPHEEGQKVADINGSTVGYLSISEEL